jgi:hypothetical protein
VQLSLPPSFDVANGCTLFFDPRYDTECNYDYFYVDVFDGTEWQTLAQFNASSNTSGEACGYPYVPSTDYWENTDTDQPNSADWQERTNPAEPAFYRVMTPDTLLVTSGPMIRWRFASDGAWSDADGRGDTDGAAFIDNVWVWGDSERYSEDFETGVLDTSYWSLPGPDGVMDAWHIEHDPDPLYEGDDGGDRNSCLLDSSFIFRARPIGGYQAGTDWRNGWFYRLVSPRVPIQNTGCVLQYDLYCMALDYTCDVGRVMYRFYSDSNEKWCPWVDPGYSYQYYWCSQFFWSRDHNEPVGYYYDSDADSVQFCWELEDVSSPGDFCEGKHKSTDFQVDNVSIGFYDANATTFNASNLDLLHDTFHDNLCGYNSRFDANDPDTVSHYSGPPYDDVPIRKYHQLYAYIRDKDGMASVDLYGSVDDGGFWQSVPMTLDWDGYPRDPENGGDYYATLCPDDFALARWDTGTVVWYYVKATDDLANEEFWPASADPAHPGHTGGVDSYFEFSILPVHPPEFSGPRILLIDGNRRSTHDYAQCIGDTGNERFLRDIYEETLTDAGYCYDIFDINGAGSNINIHPVDYGDHYDCIVWFTGPYLSNYLIDGDAQHYIRDYMSEGGKVVLCGDGLALCMASGSLGGNGEDSLGTDGEFLGGVMATEYLEEMEAPFDRPYLCPIAEESVSVFGVPTAIELDTMVVFRECPELKDMSYVRAKDPPLDGYTAQHVMRIEGGWVGTAHEVMYSEYLGVGQCVFVNFDLSGSVNHSRGYCSGSAGEPAPGFAPGTYDGRVELMRVILEDIMGLPSDGGGPADVDDPPVDHRWALHQNVPNPCVGATDIRYELAHPAVVSIKVYNPQGQVVKVLESRTKGVGPHAVRWGGRNSAGERVSSGVYFYKIEAGPFTATRKMLVLR